jgi:hypothetical protein
MPSDSRIATIPVTSDVDPDPDLIQIEEGKIDPQKQKKAFKFYFLCWMFSFEG